MTEQNDKDIFVEALTQLSTELGTLVNLLPIKSERKAAKRDACVERISEALNTFSTRVINLLNASSDQYALLVMAANALNTGEEFGEGLKTELLKYATPVEQKKKLEVV